MLFVYFADNGHRERKKIMKKKGDYIREGEVGEKNKNGGAQILNRGNGFDFV